MQMYIVGMIPLAVYQAGRTTLAKMIALGLVVLQLVISMAYNLKVDSGLYFFNSDQNELLNNVYIKTWHRFAPYYMGMMMAFFMHDLRKHLSSSGLSLEEHDQLSRKQPALLNLRVVFKKHWYVQTLVTL